MTDMGPWEVTPFLPFALKRLQPLIDKMKTDKEAAADLIRDLGIKTEPEPQRKFECIKSFINGATASTHGEGHFNIGDTLVLGDDFLYDPKKPSNWMHPSWILSPDFKEYFKEVTDGN